MSEDIISRQQAISEIMEDIKDRSLHDDPATPEDYAEGYDEGIRNAAAIVLQLPSTQPDCIRGRWIEKPHVHGVAYCSLCDYELHTNDTNFCPNCGADMRGEQE